VAVGQSAARKLLLPVNHCNNIVAGTKDLPLSKLMDEAVDLLRNHPLMPADVVIKGYIIDTETGELTPQ